MRCWLPLTVMLAAAACAEPHPESRCNACTDLFASVSVEVVHADGQAAVGLDAKTVHVASGSIVHALNDNDTGFYTIADDNTPYTEPEGAMFRFTLLDDSVELATRDVEIGTDECRCHIEASEVPMRIVLP